MKAEVVKILEYMLNGIYVDKGEYSTFKFNYADADIDCIVSPDGTTITFEPWADRRYHIFASDSFDEVSETIVDITAHVMLEYDGIPEVLGLGSHMGLEQIPALLEAMKGQEE